MEQKPRKVCTITSTRKKKSGTSKSKSKSTITKKAYKNMLSGFKK